MILNFFLGYIKKLNGCNDLKDASGATDAITKILKVGIIKTTDTVSVKSRNEQDSTDFNETISFYQSSLADKIENLERAALSYKQ